MNKRLLAATIAALSLTLACNTNPETAKRNYVQRGNAYAEKAKYKEALIMYGNALKKDPKYGEAYYRKALTELKLVDRQTPIEERVPAMMGAAKDFHRAIEFEPNNLDAYEKLIDTYLEVYMTLPEKPKVILNELHSLEEKLSKRGQTTYALVRLRGYLALADRKNEEAVKFFQQANSIKPAQEDVSLILMQTLAAKQPAEAEKFAKSVIAQNPKLSIMYDSLFMLYLAQRRIDDAEGILKQKVAALPDQSYGYMQLAAHYFSLKNRPAMEAALDKVASDPKKFPNGQKMVGDFYLKVQDYPAALRVYQQGIKDNPKDKAMYQKVMCEALAQQGKFDEALKTIDEVLKDHPKDDEAFGIRAALRLNTGKKEDIQGAIDDLNTAVSRMPKNAILRFNLGRAYLGRNNAQQAKIQFEEAIKLAPDYLQPRLALGDMLMKSGEFGRVMQISTEVLNKEPNNLPAHLLRTRALISIGEYREARQELNAILTQRPDLPDAKLQLAALNIVEGQQDAAQAIYREVLNKTHDVRAVVGLSESLMRQNKVDEAIKVVRDQSNVQDSVPLRIFIGNLYVRSKRYNEAEAAFQDVLNKDAKNHEAMLRLGEVQRLSGNKDAAISTFKKAMDMLPNNSAAPLELATIYDSQDRRDLSQPLYDRVLRADPENPIALNNQAYNLAEYGGDLDRALSMAQRASTREPQNLDIKDTLGLVYLKKNLADTAIGIFRDNIKKQPDRATFHYHLGLALAMKGNKPEAKKELDAALRANPQKDESNKIRELMAKIG